MVLFLLHHKIQVKIAHRVGYMEHAPKNFWLMSVSNSPVVAVNGRTVYELPRTNHCRVSAPALPITDPSCLVFSLHINFPHFKFQLYFIRFVSISTTKIFDPSLTIFWDSISLLGLLLSFFYVISFTSTFILCTTLAF